MKPTAPPTHLAAAQANDHTSPHSDPYARALGDVSGRVRLPALPQLPPGPFRKILDLIWLRRVLKKIRKSLTKCKYKEEFVCRHRAYVVVFLQYKKVEQHYLSPKKKSLTEKRAYLNRTVGKDYRQHDLTVPKPIVSIAIDF